MHQSHPPYTRRASSNRALYLKFLSTYTICIIYLHVTEARLEVTIVMSYFCHSKIPSDVMKNIFNSISPYIWEKNPLVNKYKKQTWLFFFFFFDVVRKSHIFPSKVCHFQYGHRFLFSKETRNIRAYKEVRLKMRNLLGSVFLCFFLQNVSRETSNVSYLVLCYFLMSPSLKIQNKLKDIFFITFSNNN